MGNKLVIGLGSLVLLLALALAWTYLEMTKNQSELDKKKNEVQALTYELRSPNFSKRIDSTTVKKVTADSITITDGNGKDIVLIKTNDTSFQEIKLSDDGKTKSSTDGTFSGIKEGGKVSVFYNGLKELVSVAYWR